MAPGLVVLNQDLSGINSFLVAALQRLGWEVRVAEIGHPARDRRLLAARTFHPLQSRWRRRYHRALERHASSPAGLAARTALCRQALAQSARPGDVVLAIGNLFDPGQLAWPGPYACFKDYTVALARRTREFQAAHGEAEIERWQASEARLCQSAARVFTASDNTRRSVIADYGVAAARVFAVGEGLCFEDIPPRAAARPADRILFVGKDFARKGGPTVLAAWARVRARRPAARLVVLGPERPRRVPDGVEWVGLVKDRARVRHYFETSTLFVMPSHIEPFGLVFLEAMALGLPCIGSRRDAMPEIIADGTTGFLVVPGDDADLAAKMLRLLEDGALCDRMGQAGRARVLGHYLWSDVARRIHRELQQLAAGVV